MLRADIIQAVDEGKFTIYAIDTVDDGIQILTGIKAGKLNAKGEYPKGSVNHCVKENLKAFYEDYARYAKETHGCV
jgi:hypothetical protein